MWPLLLSLLLTAPAAPGPGEPPDGAWVNGGSVYFWWDTPLDDAGLALTSVRFDFRRADAGYGVFTETQPWSGGAYVAMRFAENEQWCWRLVAINEAGQSSPPSAERCFRTDNTNPRSPPFVDAGAVVSTGRVVIEHAPGFDAVSGVAGYVLNLAPTPAGPWYDNSPGAAGPPLVTWLGEGSWFGWVEVYDFASNSNFAEQGSYAIPITVTAVPAVPTPAPPSFWEPFVNQYGTGASWDAGALITLGASHVVESHCNVDTGCTWVHGFTGTPVANEAAWVQLGDEGTWRGRLAMVVGGQVGPWSAPSAPVVVDRTDPPRPTVTVTPAATNTGPFALQWVAPPDDRAGLGRFLVEVQVPGVPTVRTFEVAAPLVSTSFAPTNEGRHSFSVRSVDRAGNRSAQSAMVTAVFDRSGPRSMPPMATAQPVDGGALVTLTWPAPFDEFSAVASLELSEADANADAGAAVVPTSGTTTTRVVGPGRWTWSLRAVDSLGNQGSFSPPSNVIAVSPAGVGQGPSITDLPLNLTCGVPFVGTLAGSGDAPLTWTLLAGPQGLTLSPAGEVQWTPPAAAVITTIEVKLSNAVGFVTQSLAVFVTCAQPVGGGAGGGGGQAPDAGVDRRDLGVGCGCQHGATAWLLATVVLLWRRRASRERGAR